MQMATDTAQTYMLRQTAERQYDDLIDGCARVLMAHHDYTYEDAKLLARQAHAEIYSVNANAHIDIDACTSSMLMICRKNGERFSLPVRDIVRICEQNPALARAAL